MSHSCPDAELQVMGCCALCWIHVILRTCSKNSERPAPNQNCVGYSWPAMGFLGHRDDVRRRQGNWPDHSRLLQLFWNDCRQGGEPGFWLDQAQDRQPWRYTTAEFTKTRCGCEESFYATLEVDLSGRRLDKDGESFHLLMARHPPVEDPCPSAFAEEHTSVKDPPQADDRWELL